jgi:hypothetical protein
MDSLLSEKMDKTGHIKVFNNAFLGDIRTRNAQQQRVESFPGLSWEAFTTTIRGLFI